LRNKVENEVFKRVQIEFFGRQGCIVNEVVKGGKEVKYKIQDEAAIGRFFEVRFSSSECLASCVCQMFEFKGILCGHTLFVLSQESVTVLPESYILDRWRKDIKRKHTYVSTRSGNGSGRSGLGVIFYPTRQSRVCKAQLVNHPLRWSDRAGRLIGFGG
jgi:hypothetical protein